MQDNIESCYEGKEGYALVDKAQYDNLVARQKELLERIRFLENACSKQNEEICQCLGRSLGYPWFKDDQNNFPNATEADGVCVGDHVAETIAEEAAKRIANLEKECEMLKEAYHDRKRAYSELAERTGNM